MIKDRNIILEIIDTIKVFKCLLRKIYCSIVLEKDESFFYFQNFVDKQTFYNYYGNEERWKYPFWATKIE